MGIDVKIEGAHGAVAPYETIGPREHGLTDGQLTPPLATRLFTVLCGYRLMDVMSLLSGTSPTATIVERSSPPKELKLPVCGCLYTHLHPHIHRISQNYERLSDWVKVVQEFKNIAQKEHTSFAASSSSGSVHSGVNVQINLLRRFACAHVRGKWTKITSNFLSAAVHVAFLNTPGCKDKFAELPDTAITLLKM